MPTPTEREQSAVDYLPRRGGLTALRKAADGCRGCGLYRDATQTVFGEGPGSARLMLVGAQPGDHEDRKGEPFVGLAGRLLDKALRELGLDRSQVYLTNAVKHFKFTPQEREKRRIHKKPARGELQACLPWLRAELAAVRPEVLVCLGATAAKELLGSDFRVSRQRGTLLDMPEELAVTPALRDCHVLATVHPSSVLRAKDNRDQQYTAMVGDLWVAAGALR